MDAFFASVEQRDNPSLRGRPVIVGGSPDSRGVVASCSYEARKFGIHSAMSSSQARRLCPWAVFVRGRFDAYRAVSSELHEIFREYSDMVEPLSLDEAYIDVTENKKSAVSATLIAREIRSLIYRNTGLTASAGVSYNKFIAKVASDYNKPNGVTVVTPKRALEFLDSLPVGKFYGIGKVTEKRLLSLGVAKGSDLRKLDRAFLLESFGKAGGFYYDIVRGIDQRPVEPERERKSVGKEHTFSADVLSISEIMSYLEKIALEVHSVLMKNSLQGKTITLKVKYRDFVSVTRSISLYEPARSAREIMGYIPALLEKTDAGKVPVRLLGIAVSALERTDSAADRQLLLFR